MKKFRKIKNLQHFAISELVKIISTLIFFINFMQAQVTDNISGATLKYLESFNRNNIEKKAGVKTFEVVSGKIHFISHMPIVKIEGFTSDISGFISVTPNNLQDSNPNAKFSVMLATFKTGIFTRDKHMRDRYLETHKYPECTFTLQRVNSTSSPRLEDEESVVINLSGVLDLHGVKKKKQSRLWWNRNMILMVREFLK